MLFKPKKTLPVLQLSTGNTLLYDGHLKDLPLKEEIILQKSVEFFDDPEPCHIHRSAVRTRLTAELLQELTEATDSSPGPLLKAYADIPEITRCRCALK